MDNEPYVHRQTATNPPLWTVGFYDPSGKWHPESDHGNPTEAGDRVRYLNGGPLPGTDATALIKAVQAEPEFPDPCPKLKALIEDAVTTGDEGHVLHMLRQAVRQTKQNIIQRLAAG